MNTPDHPSNENRSGDAIATLTKTRRGVPQATQCEAFLVAAFELINAQCQSIINGPETMHRRKVAGVEVDLLLELRDGRQVLIFLDGARFHGADPKINGGVAKIASDNERRARLVGPRVKIIHVREWRLPPLAVGESIFVTDLSRHHDQARACVGLCLSIWGSADSAEERLLHEPAFFARVRQRRAEFWFPRLSEGVPDERKLKNIVTPEVLADLIGRSAHADAARIIPNLGCGSKSLWNWHCPKCARAYSARVGAVLAKTESKGCPCCGGSKEVAPEYSVAADPTLFRDFIEVCWEPELRASDVSRSSNRIMAWRCRNAPVCPRVCLDRPRNRKRSTGYCQQCGRDHRRFAENWVPQKIQRNVQSVARELLTQQCNVKWGDVFFRLSASDQQFLTEKKPFGDALSKWGYKQIQKARKGVFCPVEETPIGSKYTMRGRAATE